MKLRIKKSLIAGAGKGLFAEENFATGSFVAPYTGDVYIGPDPDLGNSNYGFELTSNYTIDAARRNTAPGRMMNDPRGSGILPNCKFAGDFRTKRVRLVTVRPVRKGQEFLVPYGRAYWTNYEARKAKQKVPVPPLRKAEFKAKRKHRAHSATSLADLQPLLK